MNFYKHSNQVVSVTCNENTKEEQTAIAEFLLQKKAPVINIYHKGLLAAVISIGSEGAVMSFDMFTAEDVKDIVTNLYCSLLAEHTLDYMKESSQT